MPAKTRGGGRKIVPDRAVSLLKWRINSQSLGAHCRIVPASITNAESKAKTNSDPKQRFLAWPQSALIRLCSQSFSAKMDRDQSSVISQQSSVAGSLITDH